MMQASNAGNKACFTSTISIGKYVKKCEHTSYLSIQLVPTITETASAPVFISQEHAAGISCLLHGPITYTIGFHTERGTGISPHPEIHDVAVASTGIQRNNKVQHNYRLDCYG